MVPSLTLLSLIALSPTGVEEGPVNKERGKDALNVVRFSLPNQTILSPRTHKPPEMSRTCPPLHLLLPPQSPSQQPDHHPVSPQNRVITATYYPLPHMLAHGQMLVGLDIILRTSHPPNYRFCVLTPHSLPLWLVIHLPFGSPLHLLLHLPVCATHRIVIFYHSNPYPVALHRTCPHPPTTCRHYKPPCSASNLPFLCPHHYLHETLFPGTPHETTRSTMFVHHPPLPATRLHGNPLDLSAPRL